MKEDKENEERVIDFVSTVWVLWIWRNKVTFRGANVCLKSIMALKEDWMRRGLGLCRGNMEKLNIGRNKGEVRQIWERGTYNSNIPQAELVVDGAWKKKKGSEEDWKVAFGAICFLLGQQITEAGKLFAISPIQAEAKALLGGLRKFLEDCGQVLVKTDCLLIIRALQNPANADKEIREIIVETMKIMSRFQYVCVCKVNRNLVVEAHKLAKHVMSCMT